MTNNLKVNTEVNKVFQRSTPLIINDLKVNIIVYEIFTCLENCSHKILAFPPTLITITKTIKLCSKEFRIFCRPTS
jgi:hypothetical protein